MIYARRLAALLPFVCLALVPARAIAGVDWDGGLRAGIFSDNYKLGKGFELGAVTQSSPTWDMGLHLNYTYFAHKVENVVDETELGGYVVAYYKPEMDQGFNLRLGPHIGYSHLDGHFADLGGDVMAVFNINPVWKFYGAFIPSFLIGSKMQSLFRIGLGVEFHTGS